MNQQKLNELAERAWAYQITVYEDNGVRTYGEQEKVFSKQKFAELIVRECALTAGLMEHEGRKGIGAQI